MERETTSESSVELTSVSTGDGNEIHVQFLYFATCPNASKALTLVRDVLRAEAPTAEVEMITVETDEAARQYDFHGSPTIRVNGDDVSPPDISSEPSLACRIYRQPDGRLAPYPPAEAIAQALHRSGGNRTTRLAASAVHLAVGDDAADQRQHAERQQ